MSWRLVASVSGLVLAAVLVAYQMRKVEDARHARAERSAHIERMPAERGAAHDGPDESITGRPRENLSAEASRSLPLTTTPFRAWVAEEARGMDYPSADPERKARDVNARAARLTAEERQELLRTANDAQASAGEKVLSTFLLVQAGARAHAELRALIAQPVAPTGEPHSEQELASMRDKTLRIMAIDGLAETAKRDPRAREALTKVVGEISDKQLKTYARERVEQLSRQ